MSFTLAKRSFSTAYISHGDSEKIKECGWLLFVHGLMNNIANISSALTSRFSDLTKVHEEQRRSSHRITRGKKEYNIYPVHIPNNLPRSCK
jgi:hypothetical protein